MNDQAGIPRLVRELRERTGLTQEKFPAKLGFTFPTINRWENGRAKPSPLALKQVEDLLRRMGDRGSDLLDNAIDVPEGERQRLTADADRHAKATINKSLERNRHHFKAAREKLEKWADNMVLAADKELRDTKEQIKAVNRQARYATTVEEQHQLQEKIKYLEKKKRHQRERIFDVEDEIMEKRDMPIDALEKRMHQRSESAPLFTIRWQGT